MNPTVRQLQAFSTVARLGSFTRAAKALNTTQPALSVQIAQLEAALGLRLFDRTPRAVAITSVGRELLPGVERMLEEHAAIARAAAGLGSGDTGHVVVAALPSVASSLVPEAIAAFAQTHPGIRVRLRDALGVAIAGLVRADQADFGVSGETEADPGLRFEELGQDEIIAVIPRDHSLGRARQVTLAALADQPLILMSRDSSVRRIVDRVLAQGARLVQPVQEPVYMSTAVALVRAGVGVALLPSSASELRAATDLHRLRIADPGLRRRLGIVSRRDRSLSPAARQFEGLLKRLARTWFATPMKGARGSSGRRRAAGQ